MHAIGLLASLRRDLGSRRRAVLPVALVLITAAATVSCGTGTSACDPSRVLATEAGPEDSVDLSSPDVDPGSIGETRLLHEQDGYAFFLAESLEPDTAFCLWIERDGAFIGSGCGGPTIRTSLPPEQVSAAYDAGGDVAARAASDWDWTDGCLAVST